MNDDISLSAMDPCSCRSGIDKAASDAAGHVVPCKKCGGSMQIKSTKKMFDKTARQPPLNNPLDRVGQGTP